MTRTKTSVLVVDDDAVVRRLIVRSLEPQGFVVDEAESIDDARGALLRSPRLVLLDVRVGAENGLDLLSEIRGAGDTPVIVLTGCSAEEERIIGLDLGADDYVVKPFSPAELGARCRSVLRRRKRGESVLDFGGLRIDTVKREVSLDGNTVALPRREFDLLVHLASNAGTPFTREQLLEAVWESSPEWQDVATVTEHIRRLRHRLEADVAHPRWIRTVPRAGYTFAADIVALAGC